MFKGCVHAKLAAADPGGPGGRFDAVRGGRTGASDYRFGGVGGRFFVCPERSDAACAEYPLPRRDRVDRNREGNREKSGGLVSAR